MECTLTGLEPGLDGEGHALVGAVFPGELEGCWHRHLAQVGDGDVGAGL